MKLTDEQLKRIEIAMIDANILCFTQKRVSVAVTMLAAGMRALAEIYGEMTIEMSGHGYNDVVYGLMLAAHELDAK